MVQNKKEKVIIFLVGCSVLAFALRMLYMPGNLFFGPEQGRDFLVIKDIVENHKLTLIGSKTDISGIFHGPIFYYLSAAPYAISAGDPFFVFSFYVLVQSLTTFLIYTFAYELTGSKRAGFIASILFAVSFLPVVYTRWLSNPPLSLPLSVLFMLCLVRFLCGSPKYLLGAAFIYGLLGQAEFINFLLFAVIGLCIIAYYRRQFLKTNIYILIGSLIIALLTSLTSYVLFDIRHDRLISNAVSTLLQGKSGYRLDILTSTVGAFQVFSDQIALIMGLNGWITGLITLLITTFVVICSIQKEKLLMVLVLWIFVPPILFSMLRHAMLIQLYAGIICALVVLLAIAIYRVYTMNKVIGTGILAGVVGLNIYANIIHLQTNAHVFFQPEQKSVRYDDQLAVIDWIYTHANNRPFEFQSYTIPYFWQDAWIYLFYQYGQSRYGYTPTAVDRKLVYIIIQNDTINPSYQKDWYDKTVSTWGTVVASTKIGEYSVEGRERSTL